MTPEELVSLLEENGILENSPQSENVSLTDAFRASVHERLNSIPDDGVSSTLASRHFDEATADSLQTADDNYLATVIELARRLEGVPDDEIAQAALVLTEFQSNDPSTEAIPEMFTSVSFERLRTVLDFFSKAVVYIWLHDCESCEVVRDDFDELYGTPPSDIGWFAVYGPDCSEELHREYDVTGGPTVLFFVDGTVDARLQGAHPRDALRMEVQQLRNFPIEH